MVHNGQPQPNNINRIRRNIENYGDPYISHHGTEKTVICSVCEAVYSGQRWYLKEQVNFKKLKNLAIGLTICPACRKIRDNSPGGIVHLSGSFLSRHKDDIINMIRNEGVRAMETNPLERIMDIEGEGTDYNILTTNEKLAQRIGRSLYKAYSGNVKYTWSEDNKLVRVSWKRE